MVPSPLDLSALQAYWTESPAPRTRIRVGMDTGGIAAGGRQVLQALRDAREELDADVEILQTGSPGLSYADPLVMLETAVGDRRMYGNMDPSASRELIRGLAAGGAGLLEDKIISPRERGRGFSESPDTVILVKDSNASESSDQTAYAQELMLGELTSIGLAERVRVCRALDMGLYQKGICVQFLPSAVTYSYLTPADLGRILSAGLEEGRVVEDFLETAEASTERIVLRHCGEIDPDQLGDYLRAGGYRGLKRALLEMTPEQVIEEMKISGLRGRGGAGYPAWQKWRNTRESPADRRFVICNADEGDPGAFMDRSVLEGDPHAVLEGLMIAAYAIGADTGFFYVRAEYPLAVERVRRALEQSRAAGLLGRNILGSGFTFDAQVRLGAGAFVCGEETALIASIEGRRGSPEPRPPYPSVKGLWGKPTAINNVETLAAVSAILDRGGAWHAGFGTEHSRGTKVFAVTGKIRNPQLVEVPMGTPIRNVLQMCGGAAPGRRLKAVQTGGPSGGVIPRGKMDTPLTYEDLQALGSIMGSGGMLVMDESDSMVDVAKFYLGFCVDESCGKCAPCRIGGFQMLRLLEKIHAGNGRREDLETVRDICHCMQTASLCALGQMAPNPVLSTLKYFEEEYLDLLGTGTAAARSEQEDT